jgi:DNA-binding Lrp family transcriptional regulator
MIRYTFGWQRAGFTLQFSFSDLQKNTNLQREAVNHAIKKCLEKGYIERREMNGEYYYRLKMDSEEELEWFYTFDWKSKAKNEASSKIEPEPVRKSNQNQFENRTRTSSKIEPHQTKQSLNSQEIGKSLNTSINKLKQNEIYQSISEKVLTIGNDHIDQWLDSLKHRNIDRLRDKIKFLSDVYFEVKHLEGFNNNLFIAVADRVLETKVRKNFKGLLKTSIVNEIDRRKKSHESDTNSREGESRSLVPDYIRAQVERDREEEKQREMEQLRRSKVDQEELDRLIAELEGLE